MIQAEPFEQSAATVLAERLVDRFGHERAHRVLDAVLANFSTVDLAALAAYWPFWARPKQLAPRSAWRSWGFLCGRGFGKSVSIGNFVHDEVREGRARSIGLCAQSEEKTFELARVLVNTAPPWFQPEIETSKNVVVWPNGARAFIRTPEAPGAIRSENHELAWLSEMQSWPEATRDEAYSNFMFATRIGYARTVWDATAKKGHPVLKKWIARAEADPERHIIVRGSSRENSMNLGVGVLEDLEREFGGTSKGREELEGEMLDEAEGAIIKQAWIDNNRRARPDRIVYRVISVDPATTARRSSDATGIVDVGRGVDGQALVLGDHTGKHRPEEWAHIVVELYVRGEYDLVVVETNKGGDLVSSNVTSYAESRGWKVVVLGKDDLVPTRRRGIIYIREIYSRGPKEDRAQPVATAYERGRVSHVRGVELGELETLLTTWAPSPRAKSPDRLDALVAGVKEILGIVHNSTDPHAGFVGLSEMLKAMHSKSPSRDGNIAALLRGHRPKI